MVAEKESIKRRIVVADTVREVSAFLTTTWYEISKSAVERNGQFTVALPGGKTPIEFYRTLASSGTGLPWNKTFIFQTDERLVPETDSDNNYSMIQETLLSKIDIPEENVHSIRMADREMTSAVQYERDIEEFFRLEKGAMPCFDLILLGIGEDGHTASLFSERDVIRGYSHVIVVTEPRTAKYTRVSLTLGVINSAECVILFATGRRKAGIVEEIFERERALPAAMVKPQRGRLIVVLDGDAGSRLNKKTIIH